VLGKLFFSIKINSTRLNVPIFGERLPMSYSDKLPKFKRNVGGFVNA